VLVFQHKQKKDESWQSAGNENHYGRLRGLEG